jgi:hypothetical protein
VGVAVSYDAGGASAIPHQHRRALRSVSPLTSHGLARSHTLPVYVCSLSPPSVSEPSLSCVGASSGPDGLPMRGYCVRLWPTRPGSIDHYLTPGTMEGGGEQTVGREAAREGERLLQVKPSLTRSELVPPGEEGRK